MESLKSLNRKVPNVRNVLVQAPDPMQVDAPPEENDNNEVELYEVDIDVNFDLETYANRYIGLVRIYRLMYIADHCPRLRSEALRLAISHVITTMNTDLYQKLHQKLQQCHGTILPAVTGAIPVDTGLSVFDADWVETTTQKSTLTLEKLDVDLKNYKSNSIKESIRRGYNEIGDHHVNSGKLIEAIKSYSKARDYCTSSFHVISMCLNIVKVGIYQQDWSQVFHYIIKAVSTPDYTLGIFDLQKKFGSTLECMTGLTDIAGRKYKSAANNFLKSNLDYLDSCDVMTPNDIAIYGGLCALATFDRLELKDSVICNNSFKSFLELEPDVREVIFKFYESKYEVCLAILNKIKPFLLLDMYIGPHINQLYSNIRSKAMIQYFSPYDSADLRKMALCFNTPLPDLENELMQLILDGHIKARIDSINKILYVKHPNERVETFEKAMSMAQQYSKDMHILILKSQLIKHQMESKREKLKQLNNTVKTGNVDFVKRFCKKI